MDVELAAAVPLAFGAAVSPTVLIANLLVLSSTEQNRGKGSALFGWIDLAFSLLLLGVAVRSLVSGPSEKPAKDRSARLAGAPTYDYAVFGVVMMVTNVTTLMLFIPAMNDIAAADTSFEAKAGAAALVLVITTTVVWLPLALDLVAPHTAGRLLGGLSRALSAHQRTVGIVVALGFAAYLAVKGLREL